MSARRRWTPLAKSSGGPDPDSDAIEKAGYKEAGEQISLALDDASELFEDKMSFQKSSDQKLVADEMIRLYERWCNRYPIIQSRMEWREMSGRLIALTETLGKRSGLGRRRFVTSSGGFEAASRRRR